MSVMMIRTKRIGNSIISDLKKIGFVQVNVISHCYGESMAVIHNDFGTRQSTDLVVTSLEDASIIIDVLKKHGMYISHHEAENPASYDFIKIERQRCSDLKR